MDKYEITDFGNYNFINLNDEKKSKVFVPFNRCPVFRKEQYDPSILFDTYHRFKPDNKKIAAFMRFFPQLNILSINEHTDSINQVGYRFKEKPYINDFKISEKEPYRYYTDVSVSDEFIIGLYVEKKETEGDFSSDKIHIYNWDGNLIAKFKLDHKILQIALNPTNQMLFIIDDYDEVYKYNISELLSHL
jgi:hypothetical protein